MLLQSFLFRLLSGTCQAPWWLVVGLVGAVGGRRKKRNENDDVGPKNVNRVLEGLKIASCVGCALDLILMSSVFNWDS